MFANVNPALCHVARDFAGRDASTTRTVSRPYSAIGRRRATASSRPSSSAVSARRQRRTSSSSSRPTSARRRSNGFVASLCDLTSQFPQAVKMTSLALIVRADGRAAATMFPASSRTTSAGRSISRTTHRSTASRRKSLSRLKPHSSTAARSVRSTFSTCWRDTLTRAPLPRLQASAAT